MDNLSSPKVLVAAPVYDGMKYCLDRFIGSLNLLTYQNKEITLVDNSETDELFNELKSKGTNIIKDPVQNIFKMARVVSSRNLILSYALENGFDYVLMMDSDVILPENAIEELLSCNKDIVSGIYYSYSNIKERLVPLPVAMKVFTEDEFKEIQSNYALPDYVKTRFHMPRNLTPEEVNSDSLHEVYIPCAGCMLLSKNVFSKVKYDCAEENGKIKRADDIWFVDEAIKAGFQIFCNTRVKCNHLLSGKYKQDSYGNLVHPWAT